MTPLTAPSFLPSGLSKATPAQTPAANSVVPQKRRVPKRCCCCCCCCCWPSPPSPPPFTRTRSPTLQNNLNYDMHVISTETEPTICVIFCNLHVCYKINYYFSTCSPRALRTVLPETAAAPLEGPTASTDSPSPSSVQPSSTGDFPDRIFSIFDT